MTWNYEEHIVSEEIINYIECMIDVRFPKDFLDVIKKYDGGYPMPNKITFREKTEIVNNLVSFMANDTSYILNIIYDTEYFKETKLIPIAEDPFGNLFCYEFYDGRYRIVFWNHENSNDIEVVCNTFEEFLELLHG